MWQLKKDSIDLSTLLMEESLFTVGNGYLGVRGCFEEGYKHDEIPSIRGSYINGLYDRIPIAYGESAYGFPKIQDKQPRIMDTQTCEVYLDGERASLFEGDSLNYERCLDYKTGVLTRRYTYRTAGGKEASLSFKRLASFVYRNLLAYEIEVIFEGAIELRSIIDTDVRNAYGVDDPRLSSHEGQLMMTTEIELMQDVLICGMETSSTRLEVYAMTIHRGGYDAFYVLETQRGICTITGEGHIRLEKYCVLTDSLRTSHPRIHGLSLIQEVKKHPFEELVSMQSDFLDQYWKASDIEIWGDETIQESVRFMLFQLLQSVGTDEYANVSAKGLSGEGYEGQYFWDTEIYVIPALQINQPHMARNLLEYRHRILPQARARALELGHHKGAAYPWRTISGIECSSYFPAGTAQYHINADIAYSFVQHFLYTDDFQFLLHYGAEVIWETARTWLEIGNMAGDKFMIHNVTGPDEYTAIVSNNYYTNAMAKYHLLWAVHVYRLFENCGDESVLRHVHQLTEGIGLTSEEIKSMEVAALAMYLPFDADLNIHPQDDTFLSKPVWPFDSTEDSQYPLLLHFHPLTIYRHQVLKQADTVLAHYLLEDYTSIAVIRNSFDYYERLTTHDSSLSACIYGIMAARCGDREKAYAYFLESVDLDLKDTHKNTKDGLHMANISGTILSVIQGFSGLRVKDSGLSFRPMCPSGWEGYRYQLQYRGRQMTIEMKKTFRLFLNNGEPLELKVNDMTYVLVDKLEIHPVKAVIFDMDGVLTETSHQHFQAWKALAKELGKELPENVVDAVKGISRHESLELVLQACGLDEKYSDIEKEALAIRKNEIYLELIRQFDPSQLSEGALELLMALKSKGIKIALASASRNAPQLLKSLNIESYFDVVVDPCSINKGKPAPDIFLKAAELLDIDPSECVGVEDAYAGIESILAAGMRAIGIGQPDMLTNCRDVLPSLSVLTFLT